MGRSREITSLVASTVTLLAMGVAVAQDATAQETHLPDAQAYYDRGLAYRDEGDFDRAIADFTQAIQLDPKLARTYYNRGLSYRDKGDTNRAIADFIQAIQLNPKDVEAYGNRGVTYHRKGLGISDLDGLYSGKYDEEVRLYAFDILALDDLRKLPLSLRKQKLARLLKIRPICSTIPCYSARIGLAEEVGEVATARLPTVHPSDLNLMPDMRFW